MAEYLLNYFSSFATDPFSLLSFHHVPSLFENDDEATRRLTSESPPVSLLDGELLLLATNFLLYVSMVIILFIVSKIYFPESLISITDDDEEDENDEEEDSDDDQTTTSTNNRCKKTVDLPDLEVQGEYRRVANDVKEDHPNSGSGSDSDTPPTGIFEQPLIAIPTSSSLRKSDKSVVLKRLILCTLGLIIVFVQWGILQERMLTRKYPRFTGEYFRYTYFLVFTNRLWSLIFSAILVKFLNVKRTKTVIIYEYTYPSISNLLSSWCQYEALKYVTFPAQTLFKSFKIAPVMMMGKILSDTTYPAYDYVIAGVIGLGLTLFMSTSENVAFAETPATNNTGDNINSVLTNSSTITGIALLMLYLLFDSFTGQWQSRMFKKNKRLSVPEILFATNLCSTTLSLITLLHTDELTPALDFVYRHNEIHFHFFAFSLCSTVGQLLIFYTIKNFGAVIFAIIMTLRVLCSIVTSCMIYNHPLSVEGFLGLFLVIGAVGYRVKRKAEGQDFLRFKGIDDESEGKEMVHEWHQHVDM